MRMPLIIMQRATQQPRYLAFEYPVWHYVIKQQCRHKRNYDERDAVRETKFCSGLHVYVSRDMRPDMITTQWKAPQKIFLHQGRSSVRMQIGLLRSNDDNAATSTPTIATTSK